MPHSAGGWSLMAARSRRHRSARRRGWQYLAPLVLIVILAIGWTWLWHFAAGKAEVTIAGWREREAKAGRIYTCGSQTVGGYPFRIEVNCDRAAAVFRSNQPPVEIKADSILVTAKVYQPETLTSQFTGPLTVAEPGHAPNIVANWASGQSRVSGTPASPERVSLIFDRPTVDRVVDGGRQNVLRARRIEIHGRIVEGSAA